MARLQRLAVAGLPHLVRQQALEGQPAVRDDADRLAFLDCLRTAAAEAGVAVHAYALTAADLHLLVTPDTGPALGALMQDCARRYVGAYNRRHGRSGSLWQHRYRTTVVEPGPWLVAALVYVEQAGVRAGECLRPEDCAGCSAAVHLGASRDPALRPHAAYWALGNTPFERESVYRHLLEAPPDRERQSRLADALHKGWALGSGAFLAELERRAGRRVQPLPRGRPPRTPPATV